MAEVLAEPLTRAVVVEKIVALAEPLKEALGDVLGAAEGDTLTLVLPVSVDDGLAEPLADALGGVLPDAGGDAVALELSNREGAALVEPVALASNDVLAVIVCGTLADANDDALRAPLLLARGERVRVAIDEAYAVAVARAVSVPEVQTDVVGELVRVDVCIAVAEGVKE